MRQGGPPRRVIPTGGVAGGVERRGGEPVSNKEILAQKVAVELPLSDWLLWLGWCTAHLNENTSRVVAESIRSASKQVVMGR